jgi:hypothetical protein
MRKATALFLASMLTVSLQAQQSTPAQQQGASSATPPGQQGASGTAQTPASGCKQPCLEDGTPVSLRISQTVSSADAHVNDNVAFEVQQEVRVSDVVIISRGAVALGKVTEAQHKRRRGRGGKLEINMDSVRLADGEKVALRATKESQGGSHALVMTGGIVAAGLIFLPAAPIFLLMHGKDISIPKDTEVPTFVDGDFQLDLSKFQQAAPTTQAQVAPAAAPNAQITVTSNPPGADIELDGAYVGNTPSTIGVTVGDHTIELRLPLLWDLSFGHKRTVGSPSCMRTDSTRNTHKIWSPIEYQEPHQTRALMLWFATSPS